MNKTISIVLAGFSFVIEERAYIKLSDYLQALRNSLEKEEADEVMYDIEIRIAEILKGNMGKREVVSDGDVQSVIAQIGTPEAIGEQEKAYYSGNMSYKGNQHRVQKQLFRDIERAKISGVCAGLGYYTGIDPTIMRILWLVILFITGFFPVVLFYIIFVIAMPKAQTASDVLRMKGKPIDFENIKEESVSFASESGRKIGVFYQENKLMMVGVRETLWKIVRKVLGAIFALITLAIIILGIYGMFGILGLFDVSEMNEIDFIFGQETTHIVVIMFLGALIFTIVFAALSIKLFSPRTKIRNFGYITAVLFLILVGSVITVGARTSGLFVFYVGTNYEEENMEVNAVNNQIELSIRQVNIPQGFEAYGNHIFSDRNRVFKRDYITYTKVIRRLELDRPYLIVKKEADGYNVPMRLSVPVEVKEGKILIPNYISYAYEHRLRDYDVDYKLVVPRMMRVVDNSKGG